MATKVYGIIGDPVDQVRSPTVFNQLFWERNVDAVMVPVHVRPSDFPNALDGLFLIRNLDGLIITVPHKVEAARSLSGTLASRRVSIAGAANALRRTYKGWEGDLFDGEGFAKGMEAAGHVFKGKAFAIVGCGGAGSAIALAMLDRDVAKLNLWDTQRSRSEALAQKLGALYKTQIEIREPEKGDDVAINATPLGMDPADPLPFDVDNLRPDVVVAEVIMKPVRTKLIIRATELGFKTHEGWHMLDHQVEAIWDFFKLPRVADNN
jgi:shikimate dehydrogenase